MDKKNLYGVITSWILVVLMLVGCVIAPQNEIPTTQTPPSSSVSVSSSSTVGLPSSTVSTPSSLATKPSTSTTAPSVSTAPTTVPTVSTAPTVPVPPGPDGSSFEVHFIDVGQADAALVICDGKTMLIDGGNAADSNLIYTYLKKNNITHLDYVIATHAHEDHIGGIPGALQYATVDVVYCPQTTHTTQVFKKFVTAVTNRGSSITVPTTGMTFALGSAQCTILAVNVKKSDPNNSSIVMRIVYGETSFLFTGDAEREVEQSILNSGMTLKSTVLKVGHHGSDTSTTYPFLREIMPEYAVISVGKGNSYGHPTEATLSRLRDAEVTTFRTDLQGDILCFSDGRTVTFAPSRNANANVFGKIGPNSTQKAG